MKTIRFPHALLAAGAITLSLALSAGSAFAQTTDADHLQKRAAAMQKRFAAADANGDGRLTREEAQAKMPFVFKNFDAIDTAHSGTVSMADIAAFAKARHDARKSAT